LFPGGFASAEWSARSRGRADRPAAIARASLEFDERNMTSRIANNDSEACVAGLRVLLASTDLVTPRELKQLERLPYHTTMMLAQCVLDLLWSKQEKILSFASWTNILTKAIGTVPSWTLVTAPLALSQPERHVAVKNTMFAAQAQTAALSLNLERAPAWAVYERAQGMARTVFDDLVRGGAAARDFLDVYDFIALTQRPKTRAEILSRRKS
jgi:hypothetical protein